MGIEPTSKAWEALVLPLNYTRASRLYDTFFPSVAQEPLEVGGGGLDGRRRADGPAHLGFDGPVRREQLAHAQLPGLREVAAELHARSPRQAELHGVRARRAVVGDALDGRR